MLKLENYISTKRSYPKILDSQKGFIRKAVFCYFVQQNYIISKYFHLLSVTFQNRIALMIMCLIT